MELSPPASCHLSCYFYLYLSNNHFNYQLKGYILINEYDVTVKKDNTGEIISVAKAQLEVDGQKILCEGQGNGPVNALDNAIRKNVNKLAKYSEYLKDLKLVDYKVRILKKEKEQCSQHTTYKQLISFADSRYSSTCWIFLN